MRSQSGSLFFLSLSLFILLFHEQRRAKERTGGVGDPPTVLSSLSLCCSALAGCCCVPDVRRIIHQSGRGTIAWLSLTYQWPGAARSFASCAQPPLHSVRALGSIHPSETVSSSSIESITFRTLFSLSFSYSSFFCCILSIDSFLSFFFHFFYFSFFKKKTSFRLLLHPPLHRCKPSSDGSGDELDESSPVVSCCLSLRDNSLGSFEAEAYLFFFPPVMGSD